MVAYPGACARQHAAACRLHPCTPSTLACAGARKSGQPGTRAIHPVGGRTHTAFGTAACRSIPGYISDGIARNGLLRLVGWIVGSHRARPIYGFTHDGQQFEGRGPGQADCHRARRIRSPGDSAGIGSAPAARTSGASLRSGRRQP